MSIEQDSIVTVGTGATAKSFGISKSLDNYTLDDLKTVTDWCFSAFQDSLWNANIFDGGYNKTAQIWDTGKAASVHLYKFPSYQIFIEGSRLNGSLFTRNVLIYCNQNVNWAGANIYKNLSTLGRYHVVTDIELQDLKLMLGNNPDTVVASMPTCKLGVNDVRICPMQLIIDEEDNIYLSLFENWNGAKGGAGNRQSQLAMRGISYDNVQIAYYEYGTGNNGMKTIEGTLNKVLGPSGIDFALHPADSDETYTTGTEPVKVQRTSGGGYNYFSYTLQSANTDAPYLSFAYSGLRFNDGTNDYKPIVENGMITGYTDDDSVQSEFDTWTNVKDHVTPDSPPSPGPGGDDEDDDTAVSTVGAPFGTGLAHYYISTVDGAALTQISEAMSTWDIDATKKDLYRNLISCKIVKPPTAVPASSSTFEIYGVRPQYNGADITINEVTGNPDISFGPYTIDRKFNDFRDRAPYSRVEIFLPYCGWCALPSHVIGRSVSVAYYSDIIAGTVKAVVFCGTNPVAEASGIMSVDIPFAAQNVGEKVAAANIGMLAYGKAAIQTAAGIGSVVASKGKSGWGSVMSGGTALIGAYNQLAQTENSNYTDICGKSGDGCALAGVDTIVIKITRPLYGGNTVAPYVPDGFAHTVGFVSMKQAKVNACTGLIVCDNVEVSGISGATDAERAEIKRVLETGLYVNTPPE